MKILYHHRTLSKDGQNVHIDELIAAFRRAGHTVVVVGPAAHAKADFGSDGGFLSRLRRRLPRAIAEILELGYSLLAFARLWQAHRRCKPDLLYERYNLFLLAGAWLHRLTGVPYALEVNSPLVLERSREPGLSLHSLARWCERMVWQSADLVLPVTGVLAEHVIAAGVPRRRIEVVPNGIAPQHFPASVTGEAVRSRYGLGERIVIGFTGFVRNWHGLPAVVEAMAALKEHNDVHLLIVGDGPALADVRATASRLGLADRVTATGLIGRDEIPDHIAAFDIAIQPQATPYASPLKLFEYLALGRAVIAPDQPNLREILDDGINAVLFAPDQPESLRMALHRLVADATLRAELGDAARATIARRNLTWDGNAATIAAAFSRTPAPTLLGRGEVLEGPGPAALM